ncbi:MAG TPA: hypothetical protein PKV16_04960 [Caldisericia bacterium]|nr:hypothetical protein [Caldisericia bacterium]HPF48662.1 hypothetical protein [Caldisericia bacterium]HPI83678.1 hypothetical protein [Caldisericia bacterium]HPQ93117.1 hypothetical protein [Caldisericia bacterium]HRV75050.1 hypothetical protein [Caldisericia bacterium]
MNILKGTLKFRAALSVCVALTLVIAFSTQFTVAESNLISGEAVVVYASSDTQVDSIRISDGRVIFREANGDGQYIRSYSIEDESISTIGGGEGRYVGMQHDSVSYLTGDYLSWVDWTNYINKVGDKSATVCYNDLNQGTDGELSSDDGMIFAPTTDKLGYMYWGVLSDDDEKCGMYYSNLNTPEVSPVKFFTFQKRPRFMTTRAYGGIVTWNCPDVNGDSQLYMFDVDTGVTTWISENLPGNTFWATIQKDYIYFTSESSIFCYKISDSSITEVWSQPHGSIEFHTYNNPDGDYLLYTVYDYSNLKNRKNELHIYNPVTEKTKVIKQKFFANSFKINSGSCSGKKVVYALKENESSKNPTKIFLYDGETNKTTVLLDSTMSDFGGLYEPVRISGDFAVWEEATKIESTGRLSFVIKTIRLE